MTSNFHKIDWKTFKGLISGLHFTNFVYILQKFDKCIYSSDILRVEIIYIYVT